MTALILGDYTMLHGEIYTMQEAISLGSRYRVCWHQEYRFEQNCQGACAICKAKQVLGERLLEHDGINEKSESVDQKNRLMPKR